MNARLILFLVLGLFLLFLVIGGDVFMGLQRQQNFKKLELSEPPVHLKAYSNQEERYMPMSPMRLGSSYMEEKYRKGMEKALQEERQAEFLRQERRSLQDFLDSEAGEKFASAIELMKLGRMEEARRNLNDALDIRDNYDYAIWVVFIKELVRTYLGEEDMKEVDSAMVRYLSLIKNQHSSEAYQRAVRDISDAIQARMLRRGL